MMEKSLIRTTVTLPKSLLEETDIRVKEGKAKNRNDFIALALQKELEQLKREEIDSLLAEMTQDPEYQSQVVQMEAEFAGGSWEAWEIGEQS
ncbi:ribbon-helix-helix domain-containing protein [Crocosphaera chwakensis]|nr:ribbon-helix-helix domain-containing protein [Crocosphaera chwakensis]